MRTAMSFLCLLGLCCALSLSVATVFAGELASAEAIADQGRPTTQSADLTSDQSGFSAEQRYRWLQEEHKQTELILLVAAMMVALVVVLYFLLKDGRHTAEHLVSGSGLVLVIFGTLYVSVCSVTTEQLTAPMGIMGAIAGYLFGSAQRRRDTSRPTAAGSN